MEFSLPDNLPVPTDDGACAHLQKSTTIIPAIALTSTSGLSLEISSLPGITVLFCYPRTGAPGELVPEKWNIIPGARGCTPQACGFRDIYNELLAAGAHQVFGLSTQSPVYQAEVKERLHLPYELLSDERLELVRGLSLPTFDWEGKQVIKRVTMAIKDGSIVKVWYPVFPPDKSAGEVLKWLKTEYTGAN